MLGEEVEVKNVVNVTTIQTKPPKDEVDDLLGDIMSDNNNNNSNNDGLGDLWDITPNENTSSLSNDHVPAKFTVVPFKNCVQKIQKSAKGNISNIEID